jgi:hypothetical protein
MQLNLSRAPGSGRPCGLKKSRALTVAWVASGTVGIAMVAVLGLAQSQAGQSPPHAPHPILLPQANRLPDVNDQMEMREKNVRRQTFEAANAERLRQMNQDSEMLLTMAMALKAEIDNTQSSELSANALRKADTIEKLARGVKQKMKLTVAPN